MAALLAAAKTYTFQMQNDRHQARPLLEMVLDQDPLNIEALFQLALWYLDEAEAGVRGAGAWELEMAEGILSYGMREALGVCVLCVCV